MRTLSCLAAFLLCLISTEGFSYTGLNVFRLNEGIGFEETKACLRTTLSDKAVKDLGKRKIKKKKIDGDTVYIIKYPTIRKQTGQNKLEAGAGLRPTELRAYDNTAYFIPGALVGSRYNYLVKAGGKDIFSNKGIVIQDFGQELIRRACSSPEPKPDSRSGVLRAKRIQAPLKRTVSGIYGCEGAHCTLAKEGISIPGIIDLCRELDQVRQTGYRQGTLEESLGRALFAPPVAPVLPAEPEVSDGEEDDLPSTQPYSGGGSGDASAVSSTPGESSTLKLTRRPSHDVASEPPSASRVESAPSRKRKRGEEAPGVRRDLETEFNDAGERPAKRHRSESPTP